MNKLYVIANRFENFKQMKTNFIKINSYQTQKIIPENKVERISPESPFQPGKITLNFFERIYLFLKKKKNRSKKESLYAEYISKCNKKLDMIELIRKLEEIEKIKHILFDEKKKR